MVHKLLLLQNRSNPLKFSDLLRVVKNDAIRPDIEILDAALAQITAELLFIAAVELLNVQNEFIEIERIVIQFPQFDLPCADLLNVVQHVLQFIEVNQRAFNLIQVHLLDFGAARNIPKEIGRASCRE